MTRARLVAAACAAFLMAGCGGGGDGPDTYQLSFDKTTLQASGTAGTSSSVEVIAELDRTVAQTVNVAIIDAKGVFAPSVQLTPLSSTRYRVTLRLNAALPAGRHQGSLEVRLCLDNPFVCAQPLAGSPWSLPYDITLAAATDNGGGFPPLPDPTTPTTPTTPTVPGEIPTYTVQFATARLSVENHAGEFGPVPFTARLTADAGAGPTAAELVDELPRPEACTDLPLAYLACSLELDDMADDPAAAPVLAALQQASEQEAAGEFPAALERTAAAVREAAELPGPVPLLLGQVNYHHGRLLYLAGRWEAAATALQTARDAVESTGCIDLRADIYSRLIKVTAIYPSLPAAGVDEWTRIHATLARAMPDAGARIADAFNERGLFTLLRRHDPRAALDDLERAADLREWQLGGRPSMDLADTHLNMAIARRELAEFTAAEAALAEATRLRHAVVGPRHPLNYKELLERGLLRIDQGSFTEALADLESALALAETGFGRASAPAARITLGLARALTGADRPAEAIAAANDAARRAALAEIDPSERFELRAVAASLAAEHGDAEASATLTAMAAELEESTRITGEAQAAFMYLQAARSLALDRDAEALRQADRSIDLLADAGVPESAPLYQASLRLRGVAAYYASDWHRAIDDLHRVLGSTPEQPVAQFADEWLVLATALLERAQGDDTDRGCEVLRALDILPEGQEIAIHARLRRICRLP